MREKLINAKFCANDFRESEEERISNIKRVYKSVAEGCIELQNKLGTYEDNRSERYKENEDKIKEILKEAPKAETIASILEDIELDPTEFFTVYSEEKIADAVVYAKDLKDRYTVLWMYYDVLGKEPLDA